MGTDQPCSSRHLTQNLTRAGGTIPGNWWRTEQVGGCMILGRRCRCGEGWGKWSACSSAAFPNQCHRSKPGPRLTMGLLWGQWLPCGGALWHSSGTWCIPALHPNPPDTVAWLAVSRTTSAQVHCLKLPCTAVCRVSFLIASVPTPYLAVVCPGTVTGCRCYLGGSESGAYDHSLCWQNSPAIYPSAAAWISLTESYLGQFHLHLWHSVSFSSSFLWILMADLQNLPQPPPHSQNFLWNTQPWQSLHFCSPVSEMQLTCQPGQCPCSWRSAAGQVGDQQQYASALEACPGTSWSSPCQHWRRWAE